jgi:hypothetical protein
MGSFGAPKRRVVSARNSRRGLGKPAAVFSAACTTQLGGVRAVMAGMDNGEVLTAWLVAIDGAIEANDLRRRDGMSEGSTVCT